MPYKSEAQRRYFNSPAGKKKIGEEEVEHWNEVSKGKKLPEKALDKAIRICDANQHIGTYKGFNISWDTSEGVYSITIRIDGKNRKWTTSTEKDARKLIDNLAANKSSLFSKLEAPVKKESFTFKYITREEPNGRPEYDTITVQGTSRPEARKEAQKKVGKKTIID